jgi:hypothetical protein
VLCLGDRDVPLDLGLEVGERGHLAASGKLRQPGRHAGRQPRREGLQRLRSPKGSPPSSGQSSTWRSRTRARDAPRRCRTPSSRRCLRR